MVERKVSEILAARALDQPASTTPVDAISEAVQRRLDALEKKIESGEKEDARSEGLRFLLMAKQHKERGEDSSALKMYELATPFFPEQEKLQKKISILRAKIAAKREQAGHGQNELHSVTDLSQPPPNSLAPRGRLVEEIKQKSRRGHTTHESDDEYNNLEMQRDGQSTYGDDDDDDDDSFAHKPSKPRKPRTKPASKTPLPAFLDTPTQGPPTPRSRYLLEVVNSRDVTLIKGLSGVGAKKARDLVEFLELQREDTGGRIESLAQLIAVPGMGCRTVERMYEGVPAGV